MENFKLNKQQSQIFLWYKLQGVIIKNLNLDLWNAGLYPLVILLMTFSCAWPYIKIILMGLCWVLDGKYINYERREKILVILDTLGKWSFFDTYVVTILVVGFRFTLSIANIEA